jgi:hypothetical protein
MRQNLSSSIYHACWPLTPKKRHTHLSINGDQIHAQLAAHELFPSAAPTEEDTCTKAAPKDTGLSMTRLFPRLNSFQTWASALMWLLATEKQT